MYLVNSVLIDIFFLKKHFSEGHQKIQTDCTWRSKFLTHIPIPWTSVWRTFVLHRQRQIDSIILQKMSFKCTFLISLSPLLFSLQARLSHKFNVFPDQYKNRLIKKCQKNTWRPKNAEKRRNRNFTLPIEKNWEYLSSNLFFFDEWQLTSKLAVSVQNRFSNWLCNNCRWIISDKEN